LSLVHINSSNSSKMDEDFDLTHIESKAVEFVHLATMADQERRFESALIYYKVTHRSLSLTVK
jgi:hypothetical protein